MRNIYNLFTNKKTIPEPLIQDINNNKIDFVN